MGIFYHYGAKEEILYEAHPHIGTDQLPKIIKGMRNAIIDCGGEVHFNTRLTSLIIENNKICGVCTSTGYKITTPAVLLATGHSARDIYEMLVMQNIALEAKTFAMGVRAEHPQELIDGIQYHSTTRSPFLQAASYSLGSTGRRSGRLLVLYVPGRLHCTIGNQQRRGCCQWHVFVSQAHPFCQFGYCGRNSARRCSGS